ncbi:hypothetical protein IWX75_002615 [Arthrobacter sp. CAN_A6]|uniref:hypothetical protein n=1 Tax=Arthrobacter sp. CAN_A6 TaxID=2787721 RepID=UPI0018CA0669
MRLLAVPALSIAALAMSGAPATAVGADGTYSSTLGQLNGTTGTGTITVDLTVGATAPALCGSLVAQQMGAVPRGGADTGVTDAGEINLGMIALGGGVVLAAAAGGAFMDRRRNS